MRIQFRLFTAGRREEEEESCQVTEWLIKDDDKSWIRHGTGQNRRVHIIKISRWLTLFILFIFALMRTYFFLPILSCTQQINSISFVWWMSKTKTQSFPLSRISPLLFHNTTTAKLSEAIDKQSSLLYRREYIVLTETETFVWPPKMSWPMKSNQTLTTTDHHHFLAECFEKWKKSISYLKISLACSLTILFNVLFNFLVSFFVKDHSSREYHHSLAVFD